MDSVDAGKAHVSHLRFKHLGAVVVDVRYPLPPRQHGAVGVDGVFEVGFGDVPVTAADGVVVAVAHFIVDKAGCLGVAGARFFAACESGGGEEEE